MKETVDAFHRLYYDQPLTTWQDTTWRGVPILKCPLDLWIYQEIITEQRPELIIETGTYMGGSALFLQDMLDLNGGGKVVTIDSHWPETVHHDPRIDYYFGRSTDPAWVHHLRVLAMRHRRVMVILDSDHSYENVRAELAAYAEIVGRGCYLVVEDTNVNGHPVAPEFGPGPMEAVDEFLEVDGRFRRDCRREKFMLSFNPGGYLRRVE